MKKAILTILKILAGLYIVLLTLLYFFQEKLIFFPQKLKKEYVFQYEQPYEELNIRTTDGKFINGLLFKAPDSKGLIFYLHGNAGSLMRWGQVAEAYTDLNYDVFIPDYRGFGKSEGSISSQDQLYSDNQLLYDYFKKTYSEDRMVVLGYSIGTGMAAKIASSNHPELLILQAPYYNLTDLMKQKYPFVPAFLLKYKFATNAYLKDCHMPVVIFHGDEDGVIDYRSSLKLKDEFKDKITLITLKGQGHNGMTENPEYLEGLEKVLGD